MNDRFSNGSSRTRHASAPFLEERVAEPSRPGGDRPRAWVRYAAFIRLAVLAIAAAGAFLVVEPAHTGHGFLVVYYAFGFVTSIAYLIAVWGKNGVPDLLTWGQVLVDLSVVAATVALTGGAQSFFTFLFVIVILEATLLIGIADGFIYATLATAFMIMESVMQPDAAQEGSVYLSWYSLLVEALAFYLAASISGFWHMRLRRLQQFQLEILDHLNNGFLITDSEGIVLALNKAGETILGLSEEEGIGRPVQEILKMESGGECPVLTAIRSERDFTSYEFQAKVDSNKSKLLGLTTSRITDSRGQTTGIIASFTDLTEMDRMRSELQRQDRLAVVGELAAGLAHEIRNPLAAIRGAVDELNSHIESPEMSSKLASIAMRESDQLNEIVSGFLDFARKPEVKRDTFDAVQMVDEVADLLNRKYANRDEVRVVTRKPDHPVSLTADRSQLKQVLFNIGKNGIEAMDMDGALAISLREDKNSVEFAIDDEGPGIEPDEVARIFEPFYTTKESGVGMGLAVCQRIITAHDGAIRVTSRESGGTSMIVRLPTTPSEE